MSLSYTPMWAQDMTAGRGWVAVALVTFAAWRPFWLLIGAAVGATLYRDGRGSGAELPRCSDCGFKGGLGRAFSIPLATAAPLSYTDVKQPNGSTRICRNLQPPPSPPRR